MRFVPSAIHSTPDSRRLLRLVDVLISSTKNTAWTNKKTGEAEVLGLQPLIVYPEQYSICFGKSLLLLGICMIWRYR